MTEVTHVSGHTGSVFFEQGTVSGTPIGAGTITMQAHVGTSGAVVYFTVIGPNGSVSGIAHVRLKAGNGGLMYIGSAALTRGTGGYSRVRAPRLTVVGRGDIALKRTVLHITGLQYL